MSCPAPRAMCPHCGRPQSVCYCRHLTPIETATRVLLLQHPRERDVPTGTAFMASLCLVNSSLHVGVDWSESAALRQALADPSRRPILLYPGEGAIDVSRNPPAGPVTLVVLDGTWWQTRKVLRINPMLAALPRYAFQPARPSEYRIRREPAGSCVSTIEALMYALGALEGDPERFLCLMEPFRAMVESQLECARRPHTVRYRRQKPACPRRPVVPRLLRDRIEDVVCVGGDASAWPYHSPEHAEYPVEIIQWVAHRPSSGETFERIVAPRYPLAPFTRENTGLELPGHADWREVTAAWRAFLRDSDVVCSWGPFHTELFTAAGGVLPAGRLDLRRAARTFAHSRVGSPDQFLRLLGASPASPLGQGRAGARLGDLVAIARHLATVEP
jgi:DTW domain-containing protein